MMNIFLLHNVDAIIHYFILIKKFGFNFKKIFFYKTSQKKIIVVIIDCEEGLLNRIHDERYIQKRKRTLKERCEGMKAKWRFS